MALGVRVWFAVVAVLAFSAGASAREPEWVPELPRPDPTADDLTLTSSAASPVDGTGAYGWLASVEAAMRTADIIIEGERALPEGLYRVVLSRSATVADATTAADRGRAAELVLTAFLHASGYDIARVTHEVDENGIIELTLDEGLIDRIIYLGADTGTAVSGSLGLDLPGRIFNRFLIEAELERLRKSRKGLKARYQLVPTRDVGTSLVDWKEETKVGGVTLLHAPARYDLHIHVVMPEWTPGFEIGLGISPPDGVSADTRFRFGSVILTHDRLLLDAGLSINVFELVDEPTDRLGLTRASVEARWFTPPLGPSWLRSHLLLSAKVLGRDREDIGIDSYLFSPLGAAVFGDVVTRTMNLYLGFGFEQRFVYEVRRVETDPAEPPESQVEVPESNLRPYVSLGGSYIFDQPPLRRDQHHTVNLDTRFLSAGPQAREPIAELLARYRKVWIFGYDELRLEVPGALLLGDVPFFTEVAFGDGYIRAAFLDSVFTNRIGSVKVEYRLAIARDDVKVAFFNDLGLYEELDDARENSLGPQLVENVGIGLNLLLLDFLQVDIYGGFGVLTTGDTDFGFSVNAVQVY